MIFFENKICYNQNKLSVKKSKTDLSVDALAKRVFETAANHKAISLKLLDLSGYCDYSDYFLVMSATSERHSRSLADAILEASKVKSSDIEGYQSGQWILLDLGDIIVHIFVDSARDHYNFDKLWGHVPSVYDNTEKKNPSPSTHASILA
ncbi:MAG: ribosome silencing factor [Bdellovibrionales bacterium]|nr:ribosome silencing factor [Bdellovibrionales bacterium]